MPESSWIMSGGGPLICMERQFIAGWGGTDWGSRQVPGGENDYGAACRVASYLERIDFLNGCGLVVGGEPFDTAFWKTEGSPVYIVRICACEVDFDISAMMRGLSPSVFRDPFEILNFAFRTSKLVLFDSAYAGVDASKDFVDFEIEPGDYRIVTQLYNPDASASLVLHRFDRR